jgi:microcystin-dependent protein
MSQPFIGEIRMFAGTFAPAGWALCQGQAMSISENDALFTLIGTTYGGDGQNTFNLPDLQGRIPLHAYTASTAAGTDNNPQGNVIADGPAQAFIEANPNNAMAPQAIMPAGGSQPHENRMPVLAVQFIISLYGIFPPGG